MMEREKCMIKLEAQTAIHFRDFNRILDMQIQDLKDNIDKILIQICLINSKVVFLVLTILKEEWEDFRTYLETYLIKDLPKVE